MRNEFGLKRLAIVVASFIVGASLAVVATARADTAVTPAAFAIDPAPVSSVPPIDGDADNPAWRHGAHLSLGWDLRHEQPANDATDVYLLDDAKYLYVAFVAEQHGNIRATQHTDEVGFDSDDEVQVDLWPGGDSGFRYIFTVTPNGTHYSHSSENSNYAPTWSSAGRLTAKGYEVTMRIPVAAMRGDGRSTWRAQFVRFEQQAGSTFEWAHQSAQQNHNDVRYAGRLEGMQSVVASARTKPRVAVYTLGSIASQAAGGSTSRAGLDWAVPVTQTASFIGTVHPDYSNVDVDQQTISPTAFARFFQEVRPFFTQGANFYNPFDCSACPGIQELYTPLIPTPRTGYALEGTQGTVHFGAFDAVGANGRTDAAESLYVTNPARTMWLEGQRVSADLPGIHDDVDTFGAEYNDQSHFFSYLNYGRDRGTQVLDPTQADRREWGAGLYGPQWFISGALRSVGAYYAPVDGFVQHTDTAGYALHADRMLHFSPAATVTSIEWYGSIDRYQGHTGGLDQSDQGLQVNLGIRDDYLLAWNTGSSYVRFGATPLAPVTQDGPMIGYKMQTSTPTQLSYNAGHFGDGVLHSWIRLATLPIGPRATFALEGDDTDVAAYSGARYEQWLEKATFSMQIGHDTSLALGVRRIIGTAPPLFSTPVFTDASNVSVAFHKRLPHDELYFVYGDANQLQTLPAFTIKFVHYFGADKGT